MRLPIEEALPRLREVLSANLSAVLVAPPGAGKSTRVPLALLDESWLAGQQILMLEPRRLAARAVAARMANSLGEKVGEQVGYQIRNDRRLSSHTRILVVTEGILTRRLQDDPALEGVGLVIFDEFHERSLVGDLGLALTLATRELGRASLRILVMSATIDAGEVATLLGNAPIVTSEGRAFPVTTSHHPLPHNARLEAHVARVIREALIQEQGSILCFLPGAAEIRRVAELLNALPANTTVYQLHGTLSTGVQDEAIAPPRPDCRKIVLATNIAETSLTIEGIRIVVDSGWMRAPRFSSRTGMTRLETMRISRASADQRRGRAGRIESGICYRCWSTAEEAGLIPFTPPEIREADLAALALDLLAAGYPDPGELRWLDPPPAAAFRQAKELLRLLDAINDADQLTAHGRRMAALGTHPRYAHLLVRAMEYGPASAVRAAAIVAILEERDLLRGMGAAPPIDLRLRLDAVERDLDHASLGSAEVDRGVLARVRDAAREWQRRIGTTDPADSHEAEEAGLLLALAFPDRVAQRRGPAGKFVLRNGRGASVAVHDPLAQSAWLVIPQLDDAGSDARAMLAAPLDLESLMAHASEQTASVEEIRWDDASRRVTASRKVMLGALLVSEGQLSTPDPAKTCRILLEGVRKIGVDALPWGETAIGHRQRVTFLHHIDSAWPDLSSEALAESLSEWLAPFLEGVLRFDGITPVVLQSALHLLVPQHLRRDLDVLAPERIEVPSGSQIRVDYSDLKRPMLAVRLQEVFGMAVTPRIAGGKVAVTMQLLSPGYKPVQVTQDLESFWRAGYFDVRKDMRGRYPKHKWPEDPTTATAERKGPSRKNR